MKKYAIIIGDNNEELSRQVQEALFKVGFAWRTEGKKVCNTYKKTVYVNFLEDGKVTYGSNSDGGDFYDYKKCDLLWPSYVLARAADLDGAKKPWEIPPPKHRLVTDDEKEKFSCPLAGVFGMSNTGIHTEWCDDFYCRDFRTDWNYAVPLGFTFVETLEISAEEATRQLSALHPNKKVKVVL